MLIRSYVRYHHINALPLCRDHFYHQIKISPPPPHTHTHVHVYVHVPHFYMLHAHCPKLAGYLICIIPLSNGSLKQYRRLIIITHSSSSSLLLCTVFGQDMDIINNRFVLGHVQLECVEHLEADFSDVVFVLVADLLQKVADGIKHFLSILEI